MLYDNYAQSFSEYRIHLYKFHIYIEKKANV